MNAADPVLSHFATALSAVVEAGDAQRLREYLEGDLPAFGGDLDPADVLLQALALADDTSILPRRLAVLLAVVLDQVAEDLKREQGRFTTYQRHSLLSALYLAADLPAHPELFGALKRLLAQGQTEKNAEFEIALWRALVYTQTDASLEATWLFLLQHARASEWGPGQRTLILTAWRGLLWIPPAPEARRIVDFNRVEHGLLALHRAVEGRPEGTEILQQALANLAETYPRSADFWKRNLHGRAAAWPAELRNELNSKWPSQDLDSLSEHEQNKPAAPASDTCFFKIHNCGHQFTGLELPDIVHVRLRGNCTLEEYRMINRAHLEYAQDVSHFFYLFDLAQLDDLPASVRHEASERVKLLPLRGTVVCNAPLRARVLAKLLLTAANIFRLGIESNPVVFLETREEALTWIRERRQQLAAAA